MSYQHLIEPARRYIADMFEQLLPNGMLFHDLRHTKNVLDAVTEIGAGIEEDELFVVQMAAIFHDSGYLYRYTGHEAESRFLAQRYLADQQLPVNVIEKILLCIDATKMPQKPVTLTQQIICDADLYHFSRPDYQEYANRLKREWEIKLNKHYTELEWCRMNLDLLNQHTYFTEYGRSVLQPRKLKNVLALEKRIVEIS